MLVIIRESQTQIVSDCTIEGLLYQHGSTSVLTWISEYTHISTVQNKKYDKHRKAIYTQIQAKNKYSELDREAINQMC